MFLKRLTLIVILLLLNATAGHNLLGQTKHSYPYFFFEGNGTSFYVKVEGQMQPRFGQNHFIIPDLAPGYTHFEILFQKRKYPPQKFFLEVPQRGFRGFILKKINDKKFALYDLQKKDYIIAGNSKKEGAVVQLPLNEKEAKGKNNLPPFRSHNKDEKENRQLVTPLFNQKPTETVRLPEKDKKKKDFRSAQGKKDTFINGVIINNTTNEASAEHLSESHRGIDENHVTAPPVANCTKPMNKAAFQRFSGRLLAHHGDEKKVLFLKRILNIQCFSSHQSRLLVKSFQGQAARYDAAKRLYPYTADKENYDLLEPLFNTPFLRKKFRTIMNAEKRH